MHLQHALAKLPKLAIMCLNRYTVVVVVVVMPAGVFVVVPGLSVVFFLFNIVGGSSA